MARTKKDGNPKTKTQRADQAGNYSVELFYTLNSPIGASDVVIKKECNDSKTMSKQISRIMHFQQSYNKAYAKFYKNNMPICELHFVKTISENISDMNMKRHYYNVRFLQDNETEGLEKVMSSAKSAIECALME